MGGRPGPKFLKYKEIEAKSVIFEAKSMIFEAKSVIFEAESVIFEAKSLIFEAKSGIFEAKPGIFEAKRPKPNPRTQKSTKNPLKINSKSIINPIFSYIFGRIL